MVAQQGVEMKTGSGGGGLFGGFRRMRGGESFFINTFTNTFTANTFTDDVEYSIGKVGGLRSLIGGGEGLVMKFRGSGQVWIQTRNLASLAEKIVSFLPTPKQGQ